MGFRETMNIFGGERVGFDNPATYEVGPLNPYSGRAFAPLVDKMIGNAFPTVKFVADNMDYIRYVADNMAALVALVQGQQVEITALQAQIVVLTSWAVPSTPTIVGPPLSLSRD